MALKIKNNWRYKGDDWWEWEAFLDDNNSGELDKIDYVEYVLHPTFHDPIQKIKNRRSNFKLQTEGWGEFKLKAFVYNKDGSKKKLEHEVKLMYEPESGTT